MSLHAWLLASRPKTLAAAVTPVVMGTALVIRERHVVLWQYALCALLGAVLIQVATNFINDALDFEKGADTADRLGPVRVTQAGLLSTKSVLRAAYGCFAIAALFGLPLIYRGGWPILAIGVASIFAAYAYTGGPYPLAYHGLGEIFVMTFFGIVAVGGTYYVLTLRYTLEVLVSGVAAGSLAVVILAINNLRDIEGDRAASKRTIAAGVGARGARIEIAFFAALAFAAAAIAAVLTADRSILLTLVALPLAVALIIRVYRSHGAALNQTLAMAGALEWLFGILFLAGCLIR